MLLESCISATSPNWLGGSGLAASKLSGKGESKDPGRESIEAQTIDGIPLSPHMGETIVPSESRSSKVGGGPSSMPTPDSLSL